MARWPTETCVSDRYLFRDGKAARPNLALIMCDDTDWSDIGCCPRSRVFSSGFDHILVSPGVALLSFLLLE